MCGEGDLATIADVAHRAAVSKSTASRVLSDAPLSIRVSATTRQRILTAAAELGYRGNPFARAIRANNSRLIGVVGASLVHPFWVTVIRNVERVARERGYFVLVREATGVGDGALPELLSTRGLNAIVLIADVPVDGWLDDALAEGKTVVSVAFDCGRADVPSVTFDNCAAIEMALDHLTGLGHRRIALLGNPSTWEGTRRVQAVRDYYRRCALGDPGDFVRAAWPPTGPGPLGDMLDDGASALDELLAWPEPPTAVISGSSVRATGLLGRAHRRGVAVPAQLSVVAFGDSPLVAHTIPTLTAIDERVDEQGQLAAALVLDRFESRSADGSTSGSVVLRPRLVIGGSTGPVA